MTMDPQLLTADDVTAADFLTFTYSELDKLVAQLIKVHKAAAEAKQRAILYHKFDAPPKNYSEDFNSLLSIRYGGSKDADAESTAKASPGRDAILILGSIRERDASGQQLPVNSRWCTTIGRSR
jgi:hypothetical protein